MKIANCRSSFLKFYSLLFLLTFTVFISTRAHALVIIVSDIDDTIRASNIKNKKQMVLNQLIGQEPFPHLIDIYQDIKKHYKNKGEEVIFYYLSAAPNLFDVEEWLYFNNAPDGIIQQRNLFHLAFKSAGTYKHQFLKYFIEKKLKTLKDESKNDVKVIMFGDNGQQDPEVYEKILKDEELGLVNPKAYIRRVSADAVDLDGPKYFFSEKDLLEDETLSVLVSKKVKTAIKNAILKDIIPDFIQEEFKIPLVECEDSTDTSLTSSETYPLFEDTFQP